MAEKNEETRNIGLNVKAPTKSCNDKTVSSIKMQDSIIVKRDYTHYVPKYERYEKRTSKYSAHCPPCIKTKVGDNVRIAECRPLSKTISFVTIEKI